MKNLTRYVKGPRGAPTPTNLLTGHNIKLIPTDYSLYP